RDRSRKRPDKRRWLSPRPRVDYKNSSGPCFFLVRHHVFPMANTARGRAGSALLSIDRLCDEFERNSLAGRQPRIEDVLAQVPADAQAVAFRELLGIELDLQRQKGEEIKADEYRQRFAD